MEFGPKRPSPLWFWGPNSIMVVYMDPLVALVRLAPACSGSQALRKPLKGTLKALGEPALERNPVKGPFRGLCLVCIKLAYK